jgi:hypothetical protein
MRNKFILLALIVASVFSAAGNAQCNFSVVGTWKLVSVASTTDKDETDKAALGQHPSGILTYTADGRMMAIFSDDGRKPLSIPDRVAAPAEERAQAYSGLGTCLYQRETLLRRQRRSASRCKDRSHSRHQSCTSGGLEGARHRRDCALESDRTGPRVGRASGEGRACDRLHFLDRRLLEAQRGKLRSSSK